MKPAWADWPARHPAAGLILAAIITCIAIAGMMHLRLDASLESMFPQNDPSAKALGRVLNDFAAVDELLLLVTVPADQPNPDRLLAFAQRLEGQLKQSPKLAAMTDGLAYRADAQTKEFFEKVVVPAGLYYLSDEQFAAAQRRLTPDGMRDQLARDEAMLATPGPAAAAMAKMMLADPLRLHEFILDQLAGQQPFKTYQSGDAFISADGRTLLVRILGKRPPSDLTFCKELMAETQTAVDQANTDGLTMEYTGAYAIAAESERAIRHDSIASVNGSVICLAVLFVLAYRRPIRLFLLAFVPVMLGVAWGFGTYGALGMSLTPATAVVGAILAGMGIDYSVQFLSHYETSRAQGADARTAAAETSRQIILAIIAAWATSVVGFVAVGWSSVRALRDFALLGSLGLTGAFVAAVTALPSLLVILDRRSSTPSTRRWFLPWITETRVQRWLGHLARHRMASIAVSGFVLIVAGGIIALAPGDLLPLEPDLRVMHPRPNAALDAEAHLAQRFGTAPGGLVVHLTATSPQELIAKSHDVQERLKRPAVRAAGITSVYGLASVLPDPRVVETRQAAAGPAEAERVVKDFQHTVTQSAFDPNAFAAYQTFLKRLISGQTIPTMADLLHYPRVAELMLPKAASNNVTEAISLVFLSRLTEERAPRDAAVNAARAALADVPGATLTGLAVMSHDSEATVRRELPRLFGVAVLVVTAYLLLHFRNLRQTLLALIPAAFGMIVLLAVLRMSGFKLNLINLIALPLLVGIDVDYGIFVVSLTRGRDARHRLAASCHAVIVCAAATAIGFGSLATTRVPAIGSLGIVVGVGIAACLAGTLFLLTPLLLKLWPDDAAK